MADRRFQPRPQGGAPSPSSVSACTRENWFKAANSKDDSMYIPDNFPGGGEVSIIAESGRLTETVLIDSAIEAGLIDGISMSTRKLFVEELEIIHMQHGEFDGIGKTPDGPVLIECKRKGVFALKELVRAGAVITGAANDYTQMQTYMMALGLPRALYIAVGWDRSAWTQNNRKGAERPPMAHIEWVQFNEAAASLAVSRADMQQGYIDTAEYPGDVPRDYDPKQKKFPCTWCPWFNHCREAG